jgi:hypothetical protein
MQESEQRPHNNHVVLDKVVAPASVEKSRSSPLGDIWLVHWRFETETMKMGGLDKMISKLNGLRRTHSKQYQLYE